MNNAKKWVYNLSDYRQIFALTEQDFQKNILEYPAGISSVNAELYALGQPIVSGDPTYHLSAKGMEHQAQQVLQDSITYLRQHTDRLLNPSDMAVAAVISRWRQATEQFLADYDLGKKQGRYRAIEQPPFTNVKETFELLLCTDLLFSAKNGSQDSAQNLMDQFCHLSAEVRIFPLPDGKTAVNAELGPMMLDFQQRNFGVEIRAVSDSPRRNANAMLRVWAKECKVTQETTIK